MTRPKFVLIIGLAGLALAAGTILLSTRPAAGGEPLPNPNGYDDFVRAAEALGDLPDKPEELAPDGLRELVGRHSGALRDLRTGLRHGARVPPAAMGAWSTAQGDILIGFRKLGRLMLAEAKLELLHRRTNAAARIYAEMIRFGAESCRGGPIIHRQAGVAVESMGANRLGPLAPALDVAACREILTTLEEAANRRESAATVLANEADWVHRNTPLWSRMAYRLLPAVGNPARRAQRGALAGIARQEAAIHQVQKDILARTKTLP